MGKPWRRSATTAGIIGTTVAVMVMLGAGSTIALESTVSGSAARQAAAGSAAGTPVPSIKLITAQNVITVTKPSNGEVYFDPGIWVASLGAQLQLDVRRASYTRPVTVTQVLKEPGGTSYERRLPSSILDGWNGLRQFAHIKLRNAVGKIIAESSYTFCPDQSSNLSRTNPGSALTSPFPQQCSADDPFPLGEVWGIARGWAVDPSEYDG